jgi:hypothetical protein
MVINMDEVKRRSIAPLQEFWNASCQQQSPAQNRARS